MYGFRLGARSLFAFSGNFSNGALRGKCLGNGFFPSSASATAPTTPAAATSSRRFGGRCGLSGLVAWFGGWRFIADWLRFRGRIGGRLKLDFGPGLLGFGRGRCFLEIGRLQGRRRRLAGLFYGFLFAAL